MSHLVTLTTQLKDAAAVAAACRRLHLPEPSQGTTQLYSGQATGLLIQLPGWRYPAVIDTTAGTISYDTFGGQWGAQEHLDRFLQSYAAEKVHLEAKRRGHVVQEEQLQDGTIKLHVLQDF